MIPPFIRHIAAFAVAAVALSACQTAPGSAPATAVPSAAIAAPDIPVPAFAEERGHAALVADLDTGEILFEEDADAPRYPASLTKMMVLYLLFEAMDAGQISPDTPLPVSVNAAARPPARLGLASGSSIRARDAAQALAVRSANDAAVVIAEGLAGSEGSFAAAMTARARALGMTRTRFVNATGLPDTRQVTTARDMAILARALKSRFPHHSRMFSAREFHYAGRRHEATNNLLGRVRGVDGIKTGYIRMSGYNLVASVSRNGRRLIVIVMGGASEKARDAEVTALIERFS